MTQTTSRIDAVDGLRAIAMSMVIAQHCGLMPFGWMGVWLFFVISGYVITRGFLADDYAGTSTGERWRAFLWRRALRIVPVYLLYVAVNVLILVPRDGLARLGDVPYLLSFTDNWHMIFEFWPGSSQWGPFGHLWTLSVEQQFYLVFPLLVLCVPQRAQVALSIALVLAGPLVRWGWSAAMATQFDGDAGRQAFAVYAASLCHFDAFLIGSLIARMRPDTAARLGRTPWLLALSLFGVYAGTYVLINQRLGAHGVEALRNVISGVLYGQGREVVGYVAIDALAAALMLHVLRGGAGTQWLASRFVSGVGRVSYGGYLFHALVLWGIAQAIGGKVSAQAVPMRLLFFALAWLVTVALAWASFRWFEKPVARLGRSLGRARPRAVAPVQGSAA
jgi:peptidoglycan/LPS O-acetylase OafA/YrhL